jgi:cysteinyl-tRNA synthetase
MLDYGRLSKRPLDEMIAGARVEVAPYKRDPQDFVLWKPSKLSDPVLTPLWFWAVEMDPVVRPAEPIEPAWPSPCGIAAPGRPGWHIECSAMADKWLWTEAVSNLSESARSHPHQFDIHGGGIDLVFPHHENEIAQSRCGFHTPAMANYWIHNGFLQVEGEKMSKSLGNFVTIHDLLTSGKFGGRSWDEATLRLTMLRTHYHQPIDWTVRGLEDSERTIRNWANLLARHTTSFGDSSPPPDQFMVALADDLNTPMALGEMHKLAESARKGDLASAQALHQSIKFFLGDRFLSASELASIGEQAGQILPDEDRLAIQAKVDARIAARKAKNFEESDRIRDELAEIGIVLKDTKDGTTWEIAR